MKQYSIQTHPINQALRSTKLAAAAENSLLEILNDLSIPELKTIASLLYFDRIYDVLFMSQKTIGEKAGLKREYTNKILAVLKRLGFVWWDESDHAPSHTYTLPDVVRTFTFRKLLYDKIKNLWRLGYNEKVLIRSLSQVGTLLNIKGLFIYNDTIRESISTHARAGVAGIGNRFLKKEREAMDNPIRQSIMGIKSLKLTSWGRLMLMAYPDEAIRHADSEMLKLKHVNNPYGAFVGLCSKYCTQYGHDKDWDTVNALKKKYQMPDNAHMVQEDAQPKAQTFAPKYPKTGKAEAHSQSYADNKARIDAAFDEVHQKVLNKINGTRNWVMRFHRGWTDEQAKEMDIALCKEKGIQWKDSWYY